MIRVFLAAMIAVSSLPCCPVQAGSTAAAGKESVWEVGFKKADIIVTKDGGDDLLLSFRCWGPEWKWFEIAGREEEDGAAGARVWAGSAKIPGTESVVSMRQKMSLAGANTVAVDITLTVDAPCSLTGIVLAALPSDVEFQGGSLTLGESGGRTVTLPLKGGELPVGKSFGAFIFTDRNGKELAMRFDPEVAALSTGELRIFLAQGELSPGNPIKVSFKLVVPGTVKWP